MAQQFAARRKLGAKPRLMRRSISMAPPIAPMPPVMAILQECPIETLDEWGEENCIPLDDGPLIDEDGVIKRDGNLSIVITAHYRLHKTAIHMMSICPIHNDRPLTPMETTLRPTKKNSAAETRSCIWKLPVEKGDVLRFETHASRGQGKLENDIVLVPGFYQCDGVIILSI